MIPLVPIEATPGFQYLNHPHHRDPRERDKSQWTITPEEEREVFRLTVTSNWYVIPTGWGLHFQDGATEYLGNARVLGGAAREVRRLFVAKFTQDVGTTVWHGYPADHQRHPSN